MEHDDQKRLGIQSAEIAAEILRALAAGGGRMQLRELSAATDMHRGKVHRYLISLTRSGLVAQDDKTGQYSVGPLAIMVGLVGLRQLDPIRLAYEALPALRDQVNETVTLAVWGDMGANVVALEESPRAVTLNVRVGSVLPLHMSALGLVFAAYLPAALTKSVLRAEHKSLKSAGMPTKKEYADQLEEVRARGIARVSGTLIPGINAMAAPVFDYRNKLSSVIGLVGHQETMDTSWTGVPAKTLKAAAARLSLQLGNIERGRNAEAGD